MGLDVDGIFMMSTILPLRRDEMMMILTGLGVLIKETIEISGYFDASCRQAHAHARQLNPAS